MLNDIQPSHSLSVSIKSDDVPVRIDPAVVRHQILQALKADDWEAFLTLVVNDNTGFQIATERYEHGQNCFHVAIQSGSREIVMNLAAIDSHWVRELLNDEDDSRKTALIYAVQGQNDDPELIDAMIRAGASRRAGGALELAAKNNHMKMAGRLLNVADELGISPTHVLTRLFNQGFNSQAINGGKGLINLGVSPTDALPDSLSYSFDKRPAKNLLVAGAQGSQKLVEFAREDYRDGLRGYTKIGADPLKALRILASSPEGRLDTEAIKQVAKVLSGIRSIPTDEIYYLALRPFIRSGDIKEIQALVSSLNAVGPYVLPEILNDLLTHGDADALVTLIAADVADAAEMLETLARQGHVAAIKAVLDTGIDTSALLNKLLDDVVTHQHKSQSALQILMLAGADASILSNDALQQIGLDQRKQQIAALSPGEKSDALIQAAGNNDVVDVILLINSGADKLWALENLAETNRWGGIRALQKADAQAFHTLIECVQDGKTALARTLVKADSSVGAAVLYHLIKHEQLTLARAFVPEVTDGQDLLLQAVQDENETLGRTLLDIGVDGSRLLASLLGTRQREAAYRLLTWGADPNMAYVPFALTYTGHSYLPHEDLTIMGGKPEVALLRSIENKDATAAKALATRAAGYRVMALVAEDPSLSDDAKQAKLTTLRRLGANAELALDSLAKAGKADMVRHLVRLGAPATKLLMDLANLGDTRMIAALIVAGADFGKAIQTLQANGEQDALRVLTVALAIAQSNSTLAQARAQGVPYRINPSGSVDLL